MSTLYVDNLQPNLGSQVEIPNLKPLAGSVLQVVHARYDTQVSISGTAWTSTGLTATITPKSASSIILITVFQQLNLSAYTESGAGFLVTRDGTNVSNSSSATSFDVYHYNASTGTNWRGRIPYSGTDSPATTSAITYTANVVRYGSSATTIEAQDNNNPSFMILQEIAQ